MHSSIERLTSSPASSFMECQELYFPQWKKLAQQYQGSGAELSNWRCVFSLQDVSITVSQDALVFRKGTTSCWTLSLEQWKVTYKNLFSGEQQQIDTLKTIQAKFTEIAEILDMFVLSQEVDLCWKQQLADALDKEFGSDIHAFTKILLDKWGPSWAALEWEKPTLEAYAFAMEGYSFYTQHPVSYTISGWKGSNKFLDKLFYDNRKQEPSLSIPVRKDYMMIADYDRSQWYILDVRDPHSHNVVSYGNFSFATNSQKPKKNKKGKVYYEYELNSRKAKNPSRQDSWVSEIGFLLTWDTARENSKKARKGLFLGWLEQGVNEHADRRGIAIHLTRKHANWSLANTQWCIWIEVEHYVKNKRNYTNTLPADFVEKLEGHALVFGYTTQLQFEYLMQSALFQQKRMEYKQQKLDLSTTVTPSFSLDASKKRNSPMHI